MGTRVFVLWSHQLFFESVEILLRHSSIEMVGETSDSASASSMIEELQPDVILVEEGEPDSLQNEELLHILNASSWDPRVIRINLHDNDLVIFHREHRVIRETSDLLSLIRERQDQKDQPDA